MIRLSKMADYGIVLMTYIANAGPSDPKASFTARGLATCSGLPLPTVSKVLKSLARADLLSAQRGKNGGYTLARLPREISVIEMIAAVDGPIGLTVCSALPNAGSTSDSCDLEPTCPARTNWSLITATVRKALAGLTLEDISQERSSRRQQSSPLVRLGTP